MGGKGSGSGIRTGAGRKPKTGLQAFLHGSEQRSQAKKAQQAAFPLLPAPEGLHAAAKAVWDQYGPLACRQQTLDETTAGAFRDLCVAIVLRDELQVSIARDGLTYVKVTIDGAGQEHQEVKANPLLAQLRQMMQRVETGLLRFRLIPNGKPLDRPVTEEDPFAQFDIQ